jgi:nitrite reductase/ring-hydroxylating ferredoxin subunit
MQRPLKRQARARRTCEATRYRVAPVSMVKPGTSIKFIMPVHGCDEECFVINYGGTLFAYVNRCRHIPMAMDWVDNNFFAEHGRYLMCQTHNAYYEPDTGECISGPGDTCGKFLYRVPLTIEAGVIYATPPQTQFED